MPKQVEENEHHIVAIRMRVTGVGNLKMALTDLDQIQREELQPFVMEKTTRFEPTRLANFQSQRTRFEIQTTEIGERFHIRRIILFTKPVKSEYPA